MANAGQDIEKIIRSSGGLRELAERLGTNSSLKAGDRATIVKPRRPSYYLQFTLDCGAWTVDSFVNRPAKVERLSPVNIEGLKAQVKRHRLLTNEMVSLAECLIPASVAENDERYAAVVREFNSFEVKGSAFAYLVTYQVVRTRNGRITARIAQPVAIYYTDESGNGEFGPYGGNMPLRFLPEWVKELAAQR